MRANKKILRWLIIEAVTGLIMDSIIGPIAFVLVGLMVLATFLKSIKQDPQPPEITFELHYDEKSKLPPRVVSSGDLDQLAQLTVEQLKDICRKSGWRGWSRLRKAELIAFIRDSVT
ncbi:MAG: Rho termination factor N-terminal domain-containing protein [Hormoscilla sp. GUM202]|nr:Rho termination factor N-terminal domain-containing protein [Hormoscilla sp. GUM202]